MEKTKTNQNFYSMLEIDPKTQRCTDKIEIISLFHGTGHITLITQKGKEYKIKLADLIKELLSDQNKRVIEKGCTIFESVLKFRYTDKRSEEYDKIFLKTKLMHINTDRGIIGCYEATVRVNNFMEESIISKTSSIKSILSPIADQRSTA